MNRLNTSELPQSLTLYGKVQAGRATIYRGVSAERRSLWPAAHAWRRSAEMPRRALVTS